MRSVLWGLYGAVLGTLLVGVVGALSIQATGLRAGAVFDLNNTLAGVTSPRTPYLAMLGIAAVSSLAAWALTAGPRRRPRLCRVGLVVGFGASTVALIALSFVIAPADIDAGRELLLGVMPGWRGWIHKGGGESAVHLLVALAIGSLWLYPDRQSARPAAASGGGTGGRGGDPATGRQGGGAAAGAETVIDLGQR
ncbi:hypothetical protein EDC02_4605 [Micromonospora sp. Llam0]|uniref:hypothetical protein n=1 Tax=Micromonospora sp. Llam0 TaxID=2485143 RepID=UPI000F933B4E|nr:hypothetical protein [Micromonospora sp. Llam0]ROO62624.1 hypothetical protein EDC02_4605 [Micromonospora sp. Llam0]